MKNPPGEPLLLCNSPSGEWEGSAVIPAEAGINESELLEDCCSWTPAFAGVTVVEISGTDRSLMDLTVS